MNANELRTNAIQAISDPSVDHEWLRVLARATHKNSLDFRTEIEQLYNANCAAIELVKDSVTRINYRLAISENVRVFNLTLRECANPHQG